MTDAATGAAFRLQVKRVMQLVTGSLSTCQLHCLLICGKDAQRGGGGVVGRGVGAKVTAGVGTGAGTCARVATGTGERMGCLLAIAEARAGIGGESFTAGTGTAAITGTGTGTGF